MNINKLCSHDGGREHQHYVEDVEITLHMEISLIFSNLVTALTIPHQLSKWPWSKNMYLSTFRKFWLCAL